jgi:hypothetical protein
MKMNENEWTIPMSSYEVCMKYAIWIDINCIYIYMRDIIHECRKFAQLYVIMRYYVYIVCTLCTSQIVMAMSHAWRSSAVFHWATGVLRERCRQT